MSLKPLSRMTPTEQSEVMGKALAAIDAELPPLTRFVLVAFDEPGYPRIGGNLERPEMTDALRAAADHLASPAAVEGPPAPDPGRAET